jgi:hypothetical protein
MKHPSLALILALFAAAPAHAEDAAPADLGPMKLLICHGPTMRDHTQWGGEEFLGAFSVWCHDGSGKRVGRMDHGKGIDGFDPETGQPIFSATIHVVYKHYDDRNRDGVLTEQEVDGQFVIDYDAARFEPGIPARIGFADPFMRQGLLAIESPSSHIKSATGWFKNSVQLINRNNPVSQIDASGLQVVYLNWAVFSFVTRAATMLR